MRYQQRLHPLGMLSAAQCALPWARAAYGSTPYIVHAYLSAGLRFPKRAPGPTGGTLFALSGHVVGLEAFQRASYGFDALLR